MLRCWTIVLAVCTAADTTLRDSVLALEGQKCRTLTAAPRWLPAQPVLLRGLARDWPALTAWCGAHLSASLLQVTREVT